MRNAWLWQTFQFMIFAAPLCFGFFLRFAMFSAFMSFQNQRHFFAVFLAHFCALFFLAPRTVIQTGQSHSRLWQSFETSWFQCSPISIARQVTGRRSYNVSGTPDKLLDEHLTTYQERLTSYWTKISQRIRNA